MYIYVPVIVKTTRRGYHQPPIEFLGFPKTAKLCIISTLNVYLTKTETVRKSKKLLVTFKSPHDAVKTTTVGGWYTVAMKDAGIYITVFNSNSTRSSASKQSSH